MSISAPVSKAWRANRAHETANRRKRRDAKLPASNRWIRRWMAAGLPNGGLVWCLVTVLKIGVTGQIRIDAAATAAGRVVA